MTTHTAYWLPAYQDGIRHCVATYQLVPGDIVVWNRTPWRVTAIRGLPFAEWPTNYLDKWLAAGEPDAASWLKRPFDFDLEPVLEPGGVKKLRAEASAHPSWTVLPPHFALCWQCREIPPCRCSIQDQYIQAQTEQMEFALSLLPGCCHACNEPVSSRQKRVVFEGENLLRPDLGPAVFHLRQDCLCDAEHYDRRWADAVPGRRQKLSCRWRAMQHADGTFECTSGEDCNNQKHDVWEQHSVGIPAGIGELLWEGGVPPWAGCWCLVGRETS